MNTGPSGYGGGRPPILNGTEDEPQTARTTSMPLLLSPGPMHNQSGSKLVGGFFGSWVREFGKKIHRPPRGA